jgi:hypothetical protein
MCNEVLINPIIRTRTLHFSDVYHPTRHNMLDRKESYVLKNLQRGLSAIETWR